MFYVVGEWRDHVFVFDTNDSSCELVERKKLLESGVDYENRFSVIKDINKLKMLYGFERLGKFTGRTLINYVMYVTNDESKIEEVSMRLDAYLIPRDYLNKKYQSNSDYAVFLEDAVYSGRVANKSNCNDLYDYVVLNNMGLSSGMLIPSEMFYYIMNLCYSGRSRLILPALGGFFSNKIKFRYKYSEYSVSRVVDVVCQINGVK